MAPLTRRILLRGGLGMLCAGSLAACTGPTGDSTPAASTDATTAGTAITHVHAITRSPADGAILLATHEGLFRLENQELIRVGPVVDLMGFTVTGEDRYLASGHPGLGTDLPEPVGLIESTDHGETWTVLSRGGESDFHALSAGTERIIGFDGQLRTSTDGRTWDTLTIPAAPADLAIAPKTGTILATTQDGVQRSTDNGTTWTALDTPQLVSLIDWADAQTIVGAGTDGNLLTSRDAGETWTAGDQPIGEITALGASLTANGEVETLIVADSTVLRTTDGGKTTEQLL